MKTFTKSIFTIFIIPLLLFSAEKAFAQTTYVWTGVLSGAAANNWTSAGNWTVGGVAATNYPGQTGNTDVVQMGLSTYYGFGARPILRSTDSVSIASLTIGDNSSTNNAVTDIYIDIEGKLNVTGRILQTHSNNIGLAGDGSINYPLGYDYHIQTWFYGAGRVYCTTFQVGDTTIPPTIGINNITRFNLGNPNNNGIGLTISVSGNFICSSQTQNDVATGQITAVSNTQVSMNAGSLTIGGQLRLQNLGEIYYTTTQFQPQARFAITARANNTNTTLYLKGANALYNQPADPITGQYGSNYFDFYLIGNNPVNGVGSNPGVDEPLGTTTVVYSGTVNQEVYTSASFPVSTVFDNNGGNYQYLKFAGSGIKTIDATTDPVNFPLTISGDITLDPGTETVDLSTNNPTVKLNTGSNIVFNTYGQNSYTPPQPSGLYTIPIVSNFSSATGTTFQNGSVALTIPGTTTNGGTFNTSSSTVLLTGAFTNSGTFNQTGAGTVTANTTTTNSGIYNQGGSGLLTLTGAFTNSGTFNQTSSGPVTASSTTTNTGTYNQNGTGTLTFTGTADNQGTINDTNTGVINVNNTFTNSSAASLFSQTAGTINFNSSYSNTGTFKATGGAVYLNQSSDQSLTDNSAAGKGSTFYNLFVQNGGTKTMTVAGSGQFYVASTGILTMVSTTALASANTALTLISDANGSATVAAIPSDCTITGNVTVQRYVSANRAYRLVSSPVYTANDGTNNIYSINYLKTNAYLTGSGGGFDKTGNPTLYLYRENLAPQYSTFLNSNFRGIADISSPPNYQIEIDGGPYNIPVGNGFLFYYRGSRNQASLAALTTPGAAATNDTLNAVGLLNQQSVVFHDWYTPTSGTLGLTNVSGDPAVEGFNLVGNPYASSISFEAVTTTGVAPFAYYLIPTGLQGSGNYGIYDASLHTGSNGATNTIASGMGFFIQATDPDATLTFTEGAKINTQVTGPNLFMGKPPVANSAPPQYLRLQFAQDTVNTDETIIAFSNNAKTAYSRKEDAQYKPGLGKLSLSSLSSDNIALGINKLPLAPNTIVPLKVGATTDGNYSFKVKTLTGIPQLYDVWLLDKFKKDSVDLRKTATYSFTITKGDTATFGSNRFSIVLRQDAAMAYQLLNFNAEKTGNKQVQVTWTTKNEANYTHFTVERSIDGGKTYDVIGGLTSGGEGTYSFLDRSPANGQDIYRLKQEDYNDAISYSKPVGVEYTGKSNSLTNGRLSIFPNPVSGPINLTIAPKPQETGTYHIRITNSAGLVVKQAATTQTSWQDNVGNLYTGTYLVQVINDKDNSVVGQTKFIKL